MKKDTHPTYYRDAKVTCACGAHFTVGSTLPEIKVEICSSCHPFYTGQEKIVDTAGRVEKFKARREAAQKRSSVAKTVSKATPKKTSPKGEVSKAKKTASSKKGK